MAIAVETGLEALTFVTVLAVADGRLLVVAEPVVDEVGVYELAAVLLPAVLVDDLPAVHVGVGEQGVAHAQVGALVVALGRALELVERPQAPVAHIHNLVAELVLGL